MTDNTQELENLIRNNIHTFADEYLELDEAKQAILDWHNKQVEALLDRLEQSAVKYGGNNVMNVGVPNIAVPISIIEAERNKLKEAK